jgi:hypothetical protein
MKCLTIRQPMAWAVFHGKDVENRRQAFNYLGPLLIHAGLHLADQGAFQTVQGLADRPLPILGTPAGGTAAELGAVIGVVDVTGVHRSHECGATNGRTGCSKWAQEFSAHLVLANPRVLRYPVPASGKQGLWTPSADVVAAVRRQLA